ncbi:unnamed protein product [Prunus armeniaca]
MPNTGPSNLLRAPIQADYWFQTASSIVHFLQPPSRFNYSYASSQNASRKTPVEFPKDNHKNNGKDIYGGGSVAPYF